MVKKALRFCEFSFFHVFSCFFSLVEKSDNSIKQTVRCTAIDRLTLKIKQSKIFVCR